MTFEDRYPQHLGSGGYQITNEEPETHRKLIKGLALKKVAAISGGGEVLFLCLLPQVKEKLVAVDHSYVSLAAAYTKALILEMFGPKEMKAIVQGTQIYSEYQKRWSDAYAKVKSSLPQPLQTHHVYNEASSMQREWLNAPDVLLRASIKNLHKLHFVHGDFTDVIDGGPYDLLYLSNMLEHQDRTGKAPIVDKIDPLLKEGGALLITGGAARHPNWKQVQHNSGGRTSWNHQLFKKTIITAEIPKGLPATI